MLDLQKTSSDNPDFIALVKLLDEELRAEYQQLHDFYKQFNKIDKLNNVVVAYLNDIPVACGAIKKYDDNTAEVKRMFVKTEFRGQKIASKVLELLELWAAELGFEHCLLETGIRQQSALELYKKSGYVIIPNYGQYTGVESSICMMKSLITNDEITGIAVRNAGIVLLNNYIPALFERLGLIADHKFIDPVKQSDAVHYLQYVATGLGGTEETSLSLNKTLCGVALSQPVGEGIIIPDAHKELIEGMLVAVMGHWPAIGHSSIEGFRGNWLVRNGLLAENENSRQLTVEKRAYDILLYKSPFSFAIIKYPWMEGPLHVSWPY